MATKHRTAFLIQRPTASGQTITVTHDDGKTQTFAEYRTKDEESLKWSAKFPLPQIGDEIVITMNSIGPATVVGFFMEHGYVGVMTRATNPPKWLREQNKRDREEPARRAGKPQWWIDGIGCEFGAEIKLPRADPRYSDTPAGV